MKLNKKNKILILGFFLTLYVCYSFAISNTLDNYLEYKKNTTVLANTSDIPQMAFQLKQKEKQLDELLLKYNITNSESLQNDLLKQLNLSSFTYHLKIIDFKEPHLIISNDFTTTSYIFSLEGSFNGCLALLNKIENNPTFGSIKHLNFIKKRNYKTNADQLFVEVILMKDKSI